MLSRAMSFRADCGGLSRETGVADGGPAAARRDAATETVILNFHGVGTPARALEPDEAHWWIGRDALRAILDTVAARRGSGGRSIQLTADDGNASDLEILAPELAERNLVATFFPLAGRLGAPGSLSEADLRELRALGHRIGSHGFDHEDWRRLDAAGKRREFDAARTVLEAATAAAVDEVAVPFGRYDPRVLRELAGRRYAAVYTSDRGTVRGRSWIRPRNCVHRDMSPSDLDALLDGREPALRRVRRLCGVVRKRYLS